MSDNTVPQTQETEVRPLSMRGLIILIGCLAILVVFSYLQGCEDDFIEDVQVPQKVGTVTENGVTYDLMRYPNPDGTFSTYKVHPGPYYANEQE